MARPTPIFNTISVSAYKSMASAQAFPSILTLKGFRDHCLNAIGKEAMHTLVEPTRTMHKTDIT